MIVGGTFLIPCGETAVLLQPVDHPLHPFAGAIDGPGKGTWPALVGLPRDGDPDAMLSTKTPDRAAAVAFVAHDAVGAAFGAPPSRPLDGPLRPQEGKDRGFMPGARRKEERNELAMPFRPHVDLGTAATLTPTECSRIGIAGGGARRMLMRP